MTLHYRALPDLTGVGHGPMPDHSLLDFSSAPRPLEFLASGNAPFSAPTARFAVPLLHTAPTCPETPGLGALSSDYALTGKRVLDIVLASIALFLAAPVLLTLAFLMWIESGNPFYTQERLGRDGRRFRMYKLRSMVPNAAETLAAHLEADPALRAEWELTQKLKNDPRITPLGRLIRKTSMDELPQIVNVLKGDMSLVGPRPMLPEQMNLYPHPRAYTGLRPGITGLWQVTARNEESFALRAVMDLRYAQRLSFWTDVKILGATVRAVLRATGY